jgi:RNA polymerase subunit RPABC4/transcription elongation factor Spt4
MRLREAKICLDCDEVYLDNLETCPLCGGRVAWFLKDWIGILTREYESNASEQA